MKFPTQTAKDTACRQCFPGKGYDRRLYPLCGGCLSAVPSAELLREPHREGELSEIYFSDNGILSLFLDRKESVQLENMAAVALARAYPDDVYYLKSAKTNIDIDFYVPSVCLAVQAAYSIEGEARAREVGNLKKLAKNSQEGTRFIIVTYEEEEAIQEDGVTIDVMPLYKFLLELERGNNGKTY